jgi:hypothetical protein
MHIDEKKKNLTPEIRDLFDELVAYEKAWEGKVVNNDSIALFLEGKDKIMRSLVILLANVAHDLSEKLLSLEAEREALRDDRIYQVGEMATMKDEIRSLERVKDLAGETVLKLETDCQRKDEEIVALAGENQKFLEKILLANAQLDLLEHAYIDQWMAEKTFKALVGKKPKDVPLKDVKELLDSVRKKIGEMEMELMAGIDLQK